MEKHIFPLTKYENIFYRVYPITKLGIFIKMITN